jgi:hypothetical protein
MSSLAIDERAGDRGSIGHPDYSEQNENMQEWTAESMTRSIAGLNATADACLLAASRDDRGWPSVSHRVVIADVVRG